tara:strand:+ start:5792 stop:6586 length:795 start_codon:yes stop_codon:yes gene_type:complete
MSRVPEAFYVVIGILFVRGTQPALNCTGTPWDQGQDQGASQKVELRNKLKSLSKLDRWESRLLGGFTDLGLKRFLPQQHDRLRGISSATGINKTDLLILEDKCSSRFNWFHVKGGFSADVSSGGQLLKNRPDSGIETIEWIQADGITPVLGLNSRGLACISVFMSPVIFRPDFAPARWILNEALSRFDSAFSAVTWCAGRPLCGNGVLAFVDSSGSRQQLNISGTDREIVSRKEYLLKGSRSELTALTSGLIYKGRDLEKSSLF